MKYEYCVHCMMKLPDGHGKLCPRCGKPWREVKQSPCCLEPLTMLHGRYIVGEKLGQGGFGITYNGMDTILEVQVAIKEYYSKAASYRIGSNSSQITWDTTGKQSQQWQEGKESFLQEARKMAKIRAVPEIVRVLDTFEENNTAYIVMDYVEGETLQDKIDRDGPLSFQAAVNLLRPGIIAMKTLHARGIIHRDLSPNNIMLEPSGRLRILDLGAAKEVEESDQTMLLQRVARPHYSSFEQYAHCGTGPVSDVYSMCGVLYFCVTGCAPQDVRERSIKSELFLPEDRFTPAEALVMKRGMAIQKEQRIQTMEELLMALDTAEEGAQDETEFIAGEEKGAAVHRPWAGQPSSPPPPPEPRQDLAETAWLSEEAASRQMMEWEKEQADEEDEEEYDEDEEDEEEYDEDEEEDDDAVDQYNTGFRYYNGFGVKRDYQEAVKWFRQSAAQGYAKAQNNLGVCYYKGHGVPKDYGEAAKWYRLAAEQGNANAQHNLGFCYGNGQGVRQNYTEAAKWYQMAALQGVAGAQCSLAECYKNGQGVRQNFTEAFKWYQLAAAQKDVDAQCNLAICYHTGQGVPQDYAEAVKWYRLAAERDSAIAQCNLGICYYTGQGVPQNYAEAVKWYRLAAKQRNVTAQYNLGLCYHKGYGVPQDDAEAVKWYQLAAEQGSAIAQSNLGICYYTGQGAPQNYAEAVRWYRLAAEQGSAVAQCNLGVCYHNGQGVRRDLNEAAKWYQKAAAQGVAAAAEALKNLKKIHSGWFS